MNAQRRMNDFLMLAFAIIMFGLCQFANATTATSNVVSLYVNDPPSVSLSPDSQEIYANGTPLQITSNVVQGEIGATTASYLWQESSDSGSTWATAEGTSNAANYTPPTDLSATMLYRCTVTDSNGNTGYDTATVIVYSAPSVTIAPSGQTTANPGGSVTWTATPSGGWGASPTYTITWQKSATPADPLSWVTVAADAEHVISGAIKNILTIDPVAETDQMSYRCIVNDGH